MKKRITILMLAALAFGISAQAGESCSDGKAVSATKKVSTCSTATKAVSTASCSEAKSTKAVSVATCSEAKNTKAVSTAACCAAKQTKAVSIATGSSVSACSQKSVARRKRFALKGGQLLASM